MICSMLDGFCLLLTACCFSVVGRWIPYFGYFGYFWLLLVTGTGIRIQKFCFWG